MSVEPPGAKPTTTRTGRVGYACPHAMRDTAGSARCKAQNSTARMLCHQPPFIATECRPVTRRRGLANYGFHSALPTVLWNLGNSASDQSAAPQEQQQGRPCRQSAPTDGGGPIASMWPRRRSGRRGAGSLRYPMVLSGVPRKRMFVLSVNSMPRKRCERRQ